jgi:hypothetical protein
MVRDAQKVSVWCIDTHQDHSFRKHFRRELINLGSQKPEKPISNVYCQAIDRNSISYENVIIVNN